MPLLGIERHHLVPSIEDVAQSRLAVGQHLGSSLLTGVLGWSFYPEPSMLVGGNPDEKIGTTLFVMVVFVYLEGSIVVDHKRRTGDFVLGPMLQIPQNIPTHTGKLKRALRHSVMLAIRIQSESKVARPFIQNGPTMLRTDMLRQRSYEVLTSLMCEVSSFKKALSSPLHSLCLFLSEQLLPHCAHHAGVA